MRKQKFLFVLTTLVLVLVVILAACAQYPNGENGYDDPPEPVEENYESDVTFNFSEIQRVFIMAGYSVHIQLTGRINTLIANKPTALQFFTLRRFVNERLANEAWEDLQTIVGNTPHGRAGFYIWTGTQDAVRIFERRNELAFHPGAVVFDVGGGMYSVVFATTVPAVGFIEYDFGGTTHTVLAHTDGKARIDTIHAVRVPREHLRNNTYTIGAFVPVMNDPGTGWAAGTAPPRSQWHIGAEFEFRGTPSGPNGEFTAFAVGDWHNNNDWIRGLRDASWTDGAPPDLIMMMGDAFSPSHSDRELINYIIYTGYLLSGGVVPVLYARGNHETRGIGADNMAQRLGFDRLFWRTDFGNVTFTVFDNGSDWTDAYSGHGGMAMFEAYREEQMRWLESLPTPAGEHVVLNHMPWLGSRNAHVELDNRWIAELERQNARFFVTAHTHIHRFVAPGEILAPETLLNRAVGNFPFYTLVAGGHSTSYPPRQDEHGYWYFPGAYSRAGELIGNLINFGADEVIIRPYTHTGTWFDNMEHSFMWA